MAFFALNLIDVILCFTFWISTSNNCCRLFLL